MDSDKYPTILHVDIDAFFASVEEALCPALKGKPVIVGGLPNQRGVVSCPNYEARKLGVRTAMPLARAYALAPKAIFVRGNHRTYERYSRRFVEILHIFSPIVRPVSLDEAFLDANGCLHFWNHSPLTLATTIKRAVFEELRITVSIGIASGRVCAKVASDYSKELAREEMERRGETGPPNGLLVVPIGEEKDFLGPLPVSVIPGIGKRTAETLEALHISTVGKLAGTDVELLRRIFGSVGWYLHDAANGKGHSDLGLGNGDAKSISRSTTFARDSNDGAFISAVFFRLSERVARELRSDDLVASTVTVKMRYSDGAPLLGCRKERNVVDRKFVTYQKSLTLDEDTDSEFEISSVGFALFRKLWLEGMCVRLVGIGVTNIHKGVRQFDLFSRDRERRSSLLHGIDKIREKFGYDSVRFGITDAVRKLEARPEGNRRSRFDPEETGVFLPDPP